MGRLGHSSLFIRIAELLLNERYGVEFVDPEELLYFVEFVDEEEYFLAVQFEFEVGHAQIGLGGRPLEDAVVFDEGDALSIEPEEGVAPTEMAAKCLEGTAGHSETQLTSNFQLYA